MGRRRVRHSNDDVAPGAVYRAESLAVVFQYTRVRPGSIGM
jgi:hypothetical protein